ncbi:MAG: alpha/beta hydrolase-fold protein [Candidatus Zixiibacteriota bacterium]
MMKKFILVFTVLALISINSCTERVDNVVEPNYNGRTSTDMIVLDGGHIYAVYLAFSMFSDIASLPQMDTKIYYPEEYAFDGSGLINLPVLYLLSPFRANADYYYGHGLIEIADKMIADGEIDPMFIVCIDGAHGYGATFYGDSWAGGRYTSLIGEKTGRSPENEGAIIDYISYALSTDTSRAMRGISGFDLGGYGAMRVAIEYSENFGSVSAVSAPLDFDGATGSGGFIPLFQEVASGFTSNTAFREMNITLTDPLRTMMIGAACSFSPHLFGVYDPFYNGIIPNYGAYAADTFFIDDSLTLFSLGGPTSNIKFHLPFNINGDIPDTLTYLTYYDTTFAYDTTKMADSVFQYVNHLQIDTNQVGFELIVETTLVSTDTNFIRVDSIVDYIDTLVDYVTLSYDTVGYYDGIWELWLDNNLENILANNPGALNAESTEVQLYTVNDDYYQFGQQTRDFAATLSSIRGQDMTPINYTGTANYEASVGHYVNEILPAILKFHSDAFRAAAAGK